MLSYSHDVNRPISVDRAIALRRVVAREVRSKRESRGGKSLPLPGSGSDGTVTSSPVSAAGGLARCVIAIEGPLDKLNCLLTGKISPIHAERLLNQVRRPVQAVGGLDARAEQSGPLAVGRIA